MTECAQGAAWANELIRSKPDWRPEPGFTNVRTFEDHVRLYCEPEMACNLDFIMRTPRSRDFAAREQGAESATLSLRNCLAELERNGLEAIAVDLTTPEIAELGLSVPKVLVPGLAPLTAVHAMPALGSPRFREVPKKLGLTDPIHDQINPTPHPFP
jgi:ribosomal protein S12 methylthiotransferase accessory factor